MATTRAEMKTAKKTSANAAPLGITPKKPCVIKNSRLYKQPRKSFERGTSMKWLLFLLRLSALEILWLVYIYNIVISLLYLYIICIYIYYRYSVCIVYTVMLTLVLVCTGDHYYCYGSRLTTELGAAGTHLSTESLHASTTPCRVVQSVCLCPCVCVCVFTYTTRCVRACTCAQCGQRCAEKEEVARAHWHKSHDGAAAARGARVRSCSEGDGTSSADTDMDAPGRCPRAEWRRAVLAHPLGAIRRKAHQRATRRCGEERERNSNGPNAKPRAPPWRTPHRVLSKTMSDIWEE